MRKKMSALLTVFVILISLLPMPAAAVSNSVKAQIKAEVTKTVMDYAASVNRAGADDDAFWQIFNHGFFGNSADLHLRESDPMIASMYNSRVMQDALIEGITLGICMTIENGLTELTMEGGPWWYIADDGFHYFGYEGFGDTAEKFMGQIVASKNIYGGTYSKPMNENDEVMQYLIGGIEGYVYLQRTAVTSHEITYKIVLHPEDHFDFDADYSSWKDGGYDASADSRLVKLGAMLTMMGLDEFFWDFETTLTVKVPNTCSHTFANYHWSHSGTAGELSAVVDDGFTANNAIRYTVSEDESVAPGYFELSDTVHLYHDRPWVVECDMDILVNVTLSPSDVLNSRPLLYLWNTRETSWFQNHYRRIPSLEHYDATPPSTYDEHYAIFVTANYFNRDQSHTYRWRVENAPNGDGTNTIYLSILDDTLGTVAYGPAEMNDYWVREAGKKGPIDLGIKTDMAVGQDVHINYIGNRPWNVPLVDFDLKIWENGKDGSGASAFEASVPTAPTCTEQGGTVLTCRDCGYSYMTDVVPALGHSFGEYVFDNNASCTSDGTQTRICTRCGGKDTVMVPDTALGHDFGAYVFDNNAFCTDDGTESRHCSRCTAVETKAAPNTATGHSHQPTVTAPTCTAQGYTTYTCHCGDKYVADYVDATGHSHQMTITAPTCTEQGYTTYTCHCGDTYKTDYTDALGHNPVIDPAVPASCVGNGLTEGSHCRVCGYVIKAQTVVIGGAHLKDEGTIIKEATYDTPGTVMYQCIYCGEKSYVVLPKPEPIVNPFSDVKESDWFFKPVMWAVEKNVTGGKTATTFAPYEGCTRAQVVTFLWAANGKPMPTAAENPFTDISSSDWYYNAVLWAVENGITGGVSVDKFGPEQTCTRAQIATFLWAAKGKPAVDRGSEFTDVKDGDWFAAPVIWAKENDITTGIGDGKFGPNDTCTRAQVVTFLNKVYG